MLELINLANDRETEKLLQAAPHLLTKILATHKLDGLEIIFCEPWNQALFPKEQIQGAHLIFWNDWIDFWQENTPELLTRHKNIQAIKNYYGATKPTEWIEIFKNNIRLSCSAGAKYLVFHVSQARSEETFNWNFHYSDEEVIDATIELVNEFSSEIPPDTFLLFENLWWPGLTLQDSKLAEKLLTHTNHRKTGFMVDTGHLMNCNPHLQTEDEGIDFILETLGQLGSLKEKIYGLHLHQSLSGTYQKSSIKQVKNPSFSEIFSHVSQIDQHRPFTSSRVSEIIEKIQPQFLVHEFITPNLFDPKWVKSFKLQKKALIKKD